MSDVDVFQEVVGFVFGAGADTALISKMSPDGSSLHVHGAAKTAADEKRKRERTQAQVGLASNVVGLAAGVGGTAAALRDDRMKLDPDKYKGKKIPKRVKVGDKIYRAGQKLPAPLTSKTGKAGAGLAMGALGVQVANIGGDVVANRVLARSANDGKKKKDEIGKAFGFGKGKCTPIDPGQQATITVETSEQKTKKVPTSPLEAKKGALKKIGHKAEPKVKRISRQAAKETGLTGEVKKDDSIVFEGEISKVHEEKRQIFGWASVVEKDGVPVADLQGDTISIDEIEKSAYNYVVKSRKGGVQHQRNGEEPVHVSDMIESFLVTPEKKEALGLPEEMPLGWWVGFQVNDEDTWQDFKSGKRKQFSVHGRGKREAMP